MYNNKHITYSLCLLYVYSEVSIKKKWNFLLSWWIHGDCEDYGKNKGVGWSTCALINFNILLNTPVDQVTFIVNLTKCVGTEINKHITDYLNLPWIYLWNVFSRIRVTFLAKVKLRGLWCWWKKYIIIYVGGSSGAKINKKISHVLFCSAPPGGVKSVIWT